MTFLEGLLSFVSPCVLPMVPVYLVYMGGERRSPVWNALAFSLGFTVVFVTLGVTAGSLGAALAAHRRTVDTVAAAIIAFLGIGFIFNLPLPFKGMSGGPRPTGILSSFVFGMVFSVCLSPCVGAFLGAALMTAASEGGAFRGGVLLAEYSAGLAVPFVLSAIALDRLRGMFGFFKAHARGVSVVSGVLLVVFAAYTLVRHDLRRHFAGAAEAESVPAAASEGPAPAIVAVRGVVEFETEALKADKPVIVDFWAPWCGPCRALAPELETFARRHGATVKVVKVNVDDNPELCERYGISSIPTLFVFRGGQAAGRSVGTVGQAELEALLNGRR